MKICSQCKTTKDLREYHKDSRAKDGLYSHCKNCHKIRMTTYQRTEIGKAKVLTRVKKYQASARGHFVLETYRASDSYKQSRRLIKQRITDKYPEKEAARRTVFNELRMGRIIKQPCEICKNQRSEAHHTDYSKPLEIKWLCRKHHVEEHDKR